MENIYSENIYENPSLKQHGHTWSSLNIKSALYSFSRSHICKYIPSIIIMVDVKTCCITICISSYQSIKMIHHIPIKEKNCIPQLNSDKSKEEDRWVLVENERMSFTPQGLREKHPSKENAPYNWIQFSITIQLSFFLSLPPIYTQLLITY